MDQTLGRPGGIVLGRPRPMRCDRTMAALLGRASVARNAFPLGEDFYHRGTQADVELLGRVPEPCG
jgi:hypothetical protein